MPLRPSSLQFSSRPFLCHHAFPRSLQTSRLIWTWISRSVGWSTPPSIERSAARSTPSSLARLPAMAKLPRNSTTAPRVTLEQNLGRMLGTNDKGTLPEKFQDVVFIAIDCEAFEFGQQKTTEIGVSILDTKSISDIAPGVDAAEWFNKMRSEHYRIREFGHLVNKRWVKSDPDAFNFGSSTWIRKSEASTIMTELFRSPAGSKTVRNIVLVAHGLKNEVAYLGNLKFDLLNAPNVVGIVDTSFIGPSKSELGLGKLCLKLGMEPQSLHNAGNDAAYTLRAMVLAAILHDSDSGAFEAAFAPPPVVPPTPAELEAASEVRRERDLKKAKSHQERKAKFDARSKEGRADVPAGPETTTSTRAERCKKFRSRKKGRRELHTGTEASAARA